MKSIKKLIESKTEPQINFKPIIGLRSLHVSLFNLLNAGLCGIISNLV